MAADGKRPTDARCGDRGKGTLVPSTRYIVVVIVVVVEEQGKELKKVALAKGTL